MKLNRITATIIHQFDGIKNIASKFIRISLEIRFTKHIFHNDTTTVTIALVSTSIAAIIDDWHVA
jgi:hypothetical protein